MKLLFLEGVLVAHGGELKLVTLAFEVAHAENEATDHGVGRRAPACVLVDQQGEHVLSQAEYEDLLLHLSSFDLVLDLTRVVKAGRHPAGRRTDQGTFEVVDLTRNQATAIAELIARGQALRPAELRTLAVNDPGKIIEQARRLIDVRRSRFEWRSFHTLRAEEASAKQFQFQPPLGFKFAVLKPLDK